MVKTDRKTVWVAVRVWRGFINDVKVYTDEKRARRKESSWRRELNPDYDEAAVFCAHINHRKSLTKVRYRV